MSAPAKTWASEAPSHPRHPLTASVKAILVIMVAFGIWLFVPAEQTPSAAAIRAVCLHHEGVANVDTLEPILNRPVVVCRDGYVGYVP